MTRDGLVERNVATGEETRVSQRGQDFNLKQGQPLPNIAAGHEASTGTSRHRTQTHPAAEQTPEPQDFRADSADASPVSWYETGTYDTGQSSQTQAGQEPAQTSRQETPRRNQHRARPESAENSTPNAAYRPQDTGAYEIPPGHTAAGYSGENPENPTQNDTGEAPKAPRAKERQKRLHFSEEQPQGDTGRKPVQHGTKYQQKFTPDAAKPAKDGGAPETPVMPDKDSKLRFTDEEQTPADKKLSKLKGKAEKADRKLEKARGKLPSKRKVKIERTFDEEKGKAKHKLCFEKEELPPGGKKSSVPVRVGKKAGQAAAMAVANKAHKKISEVEKDNVGVEAAHKTERSAERLYHNRKNAIRSKRNRRYNQAAKLEKKAAKANVKYTYKKALYENPRLSSNPLSRFMQKRKLKQQYAQAARKAKQAKQAAQKTTSFAARATRAVAGFVTRHPLVIGAVAVILLLFIFMSALLSSCSSMGGGGFASVLLSSYTAEDADILRVESDYTQLEADLQERVSNIESDYPGYDEYRYSLAQIGHDPYALASYLTCLYYDYTPDEVQAKLQAIFDQQYTLTITEEVEVRYRTETRTDTWTDAEGNTHTDTYTVEVPYNYYILNVTLVNRAIYSVAAANLDAHQMELYKVYMETKVNKEYLFEGNIYVGGGSDPGGYTVPGEALSDERFAAMITEAEKFLGYPYVWGGSSPSTSFDCSGFVCWVINQSGVGSVGRTTASGLYNICTTVSASEAKPGDLIFFQGTYNTSGASHVGIYVGNGMMIHCGNPIQYTSINTNYWQSHFLAFGRLP